MSYSLDLFFKPAIRRRRALEHFAKRRHYKITGDDICYEHPHTGVSFSMKVRNSRNVLFQRTIVSAAFEINYARPTYFGVEAERELTAFVAAFRPQIADPQIKGMGEGPYSGEGFLNGWNFGNVFCVGAALPHVDEAAIETMPGEQLRAVWAWNYRLDERRDKYENRAFVPKITLTRIDGRASRVVVWPRGMPVLLPRVDYVLVGRKVAREKRFGLARWPEVVELARRAGFDAAADPLDLEYFVTPPEIAEWVANIPLIDVAAYERLSAYQILDDELIASARQSAERNHAPANPLPM